MEDNKMIMYLDNPRAPSAQRIDVTMAFNLGLAIARKDFDKISYFKY